LDAIFDLSPLKEVVQKYDQIVVTGATGWLGKETLSLLRSVLGPEYTTRVTAVAGRGLSRPSPEVGTTISWNEFVQLDSVNLLIHLAFLNREKASGLGLSNYIQSNQKITQDVASFLANNPGCALLNASSGAVSAYEPDINSSDPMFVYSALKKEAEDLFNGLECIQTVVNMRIWNITGKFISLDSPFLIVDLLKQAISSNAMRIDGNSSSTRTYINAREMMIVFFLALNLNEKQTIDSGGYKITFKQLAESIARKFNISSNNCQFNGEDYPSQHYNPDSRDFAILAERFGLILSPVDSQLDNLLEAFGLNSDPSGKWVR